ncbi:MAG: pilus assembly protein, partial [Chloroflexi bacterium]|nr:pilus assembly protein [Chloroflexota bacterium]
MDKVRQIRGQSLVEFALCLSLLMLIFLGVFDLGRVFHAYIVITNAAREGAYYGAMHPSDSSGIVARVLSEAQGSGVALSASNVSVSSTGISGTPM